MTEDGNGKKDDDNTVVVPYRITKHPENMWFVRHLMNYEAALLDAAGELKKIADEAVVSPEPVGVEQTGALSRVALTVAAESAAFGYGVNPAMDRRKRARR